MINNLIILPLEINGKELNFILDTGVNKTILFNLSQNDSIGLKNIETIALQGLGGGKPVDALLSKNNRFRIKNLISSNEELYVVLKDDFDLSGKMGITIHGIIGHKLLKNVIIRINYKTKKIDFYNPKYYKYKKCKRCETFPLEFYRNKPYINVSAQIDTLGNNITDLKMLIDSGGSDAMWLFENTKVEIKTPIKHFNDLLGEGLSGAIYGNRSKIPYIKIGRFVVKKPTVSFLDSISTFNARKFKERNGSIGGTILKRFKVIIDYPNKKISLKKNASLKDGFYYNMSGLSVVFIGKKLIREEQETKVIGAYGTNNGSSSNNTLSLVTSYTYKFKPSYKVNNVVSGSPSAFAGIKKDDIILEINNKPVHNYTLDEITSLFQKKPNRKIKMLVERKGLKLKFEFKLKERI
ncbi:aspartyl protease family protein [Tenacibaculum todarodis]|uniref:aspartyl protease family protein n=1 Tax=Tenacibaculum todarodis TaxID=1850252 RepID=UPI001F1E9A89|nr:aspartyl protease family protein [Tenacibaculum todarodis]